MIEYTKCIRCGFIFAPDFYNWSQEDFKEKIYTEDYHEFDPGYDGERAKACAEFLFGMPTGLPKNLSFLDYGSGQGHLSKIFKKDNRSMQDYDPFIHSSLPKDKYDVITAFEVFEHSTDLNDLISNIDHLLKPKGLVFFSTQLTDGCKEDILDWWYCSPRAGHVSLFSATSLATLADKRGFKISSLFDGMHVLYKELPEWFKGVLRASGVKLEEDNSYTDPNIKDEKYNISDYYRSMEVLHTGNLIKGMELYGARWLTPDLIGFKQNLMERNPNWVNSLKDIVGKKVLVTGEQGLGDELMFSQVIPLIEGQTKSITFITSFINHDFLQFNLNSEKTKVLDTMVSLGLNATPLCKEHDVVTSVGELFRLYIIENEKVPRSLYKRPNPEDNQSKDMVGFVFKTRVTSDTPRAFDPQILKYTLKQFKIANFQVPKSVLGWDNETMFGNNITTMTDTANLLNTKCNITCDTSFAHLSLLLGIKTAILFDTYVDWRWKTELYPEATLLRISNKEGIQNWILENSK
jgi:SAM-dependent methyltransferase